MAAIVDTSILIDTLRALREARDLLRSELATGEPVFASVLTKAEVLAGMRAGEERRTRILLGAVIWIDVSESIAEGAGALARRYRRTHPGIDLVDYVIAATRQDLGVPLWTLNVRHFPMIRRLRPPY